MSLGFFVGWRDTWSATVVALGLLVAALPMDELLLRYVDERWFSKSFVITYWQTEKISFPKNSFDVKVLGCYVWFENSCFLQKDIFNSLCILFIYY